MKVLITGAASNIGFAVGVKLLKLGHFVYFTVHNDYEIDEVLTKLNKQNLANFTCFKLDITNEKDRKKIRDIEVDCLINNAAIGIGGSLIELDIDKLKENFEVNVFSSLRLTQIYLAHLFLEKQPGKVIFMSSIAGIIPISFLGSYSATKASLISIATVLRREVRLLTKDIKIKLVEPGIYNTGFNDVMLENKLAFKSKYFSDLESITLKQKKLFQLIGKDKVTSIANEIVKAVLDDNNKLIYRAPLSQVIMAKLYEILFR